MVDTVTRIDAAERRVTLASGGTVGYDYLIYAVGSGSADPRVPGAAEFAYPIASLEEAQRLRPVIDAAPATAAVTVVGAGPTGIETAAELAEQGRNVTLVCGEVLGPYLHPRGRRAVARRFAKLGVTVLEGPGATVTAVTRDAVQLGDGRELPSEVTIWTAGFGVPDLAARSGLSTDALGRLLTDETLTSVDDARIVAAGDSAAPSGLPFRMSCQAAVQLGAHAAETVLSRIAGEQPAPSTWGSSASASAWAVAPASSSSPTRTTPRQGFYLGGRHGRSSRSSCAGAPSSSWRRRRASPVRSTSGPRMQAPAGAAGQARRGANGRLNGQPRARIDRWSRTQGRAVEGRKGREMSDHATDPATEAFVAHRNLLFTVAYEMLGSAADAEDVLQETWLRWVKVDLDQVRDQRAYLVRITTRQSLNRLRTMQRRKEAYVGPWLPEPLLTAPDVAEDVELAESVSMAMMLVLETLSPTERAVFVLREAFDVGYDEIAAAVDKSPAAVRQIAHRARQHVDARRPREVVSPSETRAALESFQRAVETGDLQGLLDVLAPEVVVVGDGGGVKQAALRPIIGAEKVVRMFVGGLRQDRRHAHRRTHRGQRQPGARRAPGRRARRRRGDPGRGRPHHRPLLRPQPGEAVPRRVRDPAHPALNPGGGIGTWEPGPNPTKAR